MAVTTRASTRAQTATSARQAVRRPRKKVLFAITQRALFRNRMPQEVVNEIVKHGVRSEDGILVARGYPEQVGVMPSRNVKRSVKRLLRPFSGGEGMLEEAEKALWEQNEVVSPASTLVNYATSDRCWDDQLRDFEPQIQKAHFIIHASGRTGFGVPNQFQPARGPIGHLYNAYRFISYALQDCASLHSLTIQLLYDSRHTSPFHLSNRLRCLLLYLRHKKVNKPLQNAIIVVSPAGRVRKADQSHPVKVEDYEIAVEGEGDLAGVPQSQLHWWMAQRFFRFAGGHRRCRVAVRLA